jgi:hypothetical protein
MSEKGPDLSNAVLFIPTETTGCVPVAVYFPAHSIL